MLKTFHSKFMLLQIKLFVFVSGFEPRKKKFWLYVKKEKEKKLQDHETEKNRK
jgi:hypothetical protein